MSASLQDPLDRLRGLIEAELHELGWLGSSPQGFRAGLHRALELVEQVQQERREIEKGVSGPRDEVAKMGCWASLGCSSPVAVRV